MKQHKQKKGTKQGRKRTGTKKIKSKKEKGNKALRNKMKRGGKNFDKKAIKEKERKIKILAHELLASTLSYLMLAPW
jgi:hypothetical protein